jgi:hypothetical protein
VARRVTWCHCGGAWRGGWGVGGGGFGGPRSIQADVHDSIEDARTALLLYRKYLELRAEGRFHEVLEHIYEHGASVGWQVPDPR